MTDHHLIPTAQEADVLRVLRDVRYGQVLVQVHDGRVVQIERTERFRPEQRAGAVPRGT